jgi:Holliday junction resolvase RusA-like endonuclease
MTGMDTLFGLAPEILPPAPAIEVAPAPDRSRPPVCVFEVRDRPAPQGSKKGFVNPRTGHVVMREMSPHVGNWRDSVRAVALRTWGGRALLDEPLHAAFVFTTLRPKGHYRTGKNAHLLRPGVPVQPPSAPDLSKLIRATEDAITGAIWRDDALVTEYRRAAKVYAGEDPDALDVPGCLIRIYTIGEAP